MTDKALDALQAWSSALLADAMDAQGILPTDVLPQLSSTELTGVAYTVELPAGDNLGLHVAVTRAERGSVIVAKLTTESEFGLWGAVLGTAAAAAGIAGLVTNGWVRDRDELAVLGLPVFARGASIRKTTKNTVGRHQVPVAFGDVWIMPGDFVRGDSDGVVVIPRSRVTEVLEAARVIQQKEEHLIQGINDGKTTIQLLGLETESGEENGSDLEEGRPWDS